ncbi:MAG: accessory gene regulator B family protein [Tepidibacter sp.]|jgi:accessory gene regulator B|uniref:accessory gene regulator B family protein n=1 Tax=Tepidibacter sp. TaxID=2529387 RepID=UPI0025F60D47|nr:accessory gene regulator B family protein [Tepidibacter sp.]MCT4507726.1 accessory gene regulator B family protein [Tepidibacter sp.]
MNIIFKLSNNIIDSIHPYIKDTSNDVLEIAKYGLNVLLMDLYKLPIVFGFSYYLGIFKDCFLSYILFGLLRNHVHGLHMRSGRGCLFFSCISLFSIIYISKQVLIHWILKMIISLLVIYFICKYAPADTEERRLLNETTRKRKNKIYIFIGIIYITISFVFPNKVISNIFLLILVLECIMIHPITYKLFNRRYNNYEYF